MLQAIPKTKSEQKQLSHAISAYQKQQEKLAQQVSAPLRPHQDHLRTGIILDIDGTLALRGDRGIYEFSKCLDDTKSKAIAYIAQWFFPHHDIFVITGREEMYREVTEQWLAQSMISYKKLFMRRTGDRRASNIVKEDIYIEHLRDNYNILFAIDDRKQDLDMWRSNGIYCLEADNTRE